MQGINSNNSQVSQQNQVAATSVHSPSRLNVDAETNSSHFTVYMRVAVQKHIRDQLSCLFYQSTLCSFAFSFFLCGRKSGVLQTDIKRIRVVSLESCP